MRLLLTVCIPFCLLVSLQSAWAQGDSSSSLKILVFGDSGTGDQNQFTIAESMETICSHKGCEMALMAGDNIYEDGATSVNDPQFISKFEEPYQNLNFPFYVALGNHDIRSGSNGTQAQIDYTSISNKWKMYDVYYSFEKADSEFFVIDTNTFADDQTQQQWLSDALETSTASWKVVLGHHSHHSVGYHKSIDFFEGFKLGRLESAIDPILCEYVDIYVGGHDHHLQTGKRDCGYINIVSGAAAKSRGTTSYLVRNQGEQLQFSKGNQLGFHFLELKQDRAVVSVYDELSGLLHEVSYAKRN